MARPKLHESAAARQAAYRATKASRVVAPAQAAKIDEIAAALEQSPAAVLESMIRFALMNRNWKGLGLM